MACEGISLRIIASFILGVVATLTLMVFHQTSNFDGDKSLEKLSFSNETVSTVSGFVSAVEEGCRRPRDIIMTSVNWACAKPDSLLDIFLQSFWTGEKIDHFLNHLLIVAFDPQAFERCKLVHHYCYQLKVDVDFTAPQEFLSKGYIELVWGKIELQRYILEEGYNVLFTDVDILWFRNPFKIITVYADMATSCDKYWGDPDAIYNWANTGFYYVKSSNKTIQMMRYWLDARNRFPPHHEQNIFNQIKPDLVDALGLNIQFVDQKYFGSFCEFSSDLNKICTMHANCCVNGLDAKIHDMRNLMEYWKNYTALPKEEKNKGWFTWTKPGHCKIPDN
ncbi:hypothetical protein LUZ61_012834 [Rhynchospora tenuis]|uniref:Nucleotide-diphospho-sugar transferase domain-containing protein n=1 Tax=Rhynchospora tenuis TaxID=198213 RepID=A0AAD6A3N3_9POAL|nr:hypothetical protein LUZ61_012834 [Rhynchospora tenuis]